MRWVEDLELQDSSVWPHDEPRKVYVRTVGGTELLSAVVLPRMHVDSTLQKDIYISILFKQPDNSTTLQHCDLNTKSDLTK